MDPKHILMRLGLKYLREAGGRLVIHKSLLKTERSLSDEIAAVSSVDLTNDFIHVVLKVKP